MKDNLKLAIFDLDGVITSTETLHFLAWKKIIYQHFKVVIEDNDINLVRGISRAQSLLVLLKKYNLKLNSPVEFKKLLFIKNQQYLLNLQKLSQKDLKPHIWRLINFLKAHQVLIGLGSASANAPLILEKLGLIKAFDVIVDVKTIKNPKPDPELFLAVAKKAKVNNANACIVIEDAQAGIDAANAAKMVAIGYGNTQNLINCAFFGNDHLAIKNWLANNYFN